MNDIVLLDEDDRSDGRCDGCDGCDECDPFLTRMNQMLSVVQLLVKRMDVLERRQKHLERKQQLDLIRSSPYSHRSRSNLFSFFV